MSITEFFEDKLIPLAIQVGCPLSDFWYESPKLFWSYVYVYTENKRQETKIWKMRADTEAWMQGAYVLSAISHVLSKSEDGRYPKEPMFFRQGETEKSELPAMSESERQIRNQVQRAKDTLELINGGSRRIIGESRI